MGNKSLYWVAWDPLFYHSLTTGQLVCHLQRRIVLSCNRALCMDHEGAVNRNTCEAIIECNRTAWKLSSGWHLTLLIFLSHLTRLRQKAFAYSDYWFKLTACSALSLSQSVLPPFFFLFYDCFQIVILIVLRCESPWTFFSRTEQQFKSFSVDITLNL